MEKTTNKNTKALIAVVLGNSIFGFSFLFSKLALELTIPCVLIAVRFTVAFIVLNIIVLSGKILKDKNNKSIVEFSLKGKPLKNVLLLSLFQPVIYFIAENYGIVYTSSAYAGIIISIVPIAGVIFDVILVETKVSFKQILCAIGSVIGVTLTAIGAKDMSSSLKGTLFLLIAVVSSALFYVFSKKSSNYYNPIERTYVMFASGSVFYILLSIVQCRGQYDTLVFNALLSPTFWVAILYLAVVSSVAAFLLLNYGSNYVSVSQATIFANITTVISIVAGILVLHESFSIGQAIGALIIIISVYLAK